jgi:hypothetical protein
MRKRTQPPGAAGPADLHNAQIAPLVLPRGEFGLAARKRERFIGMGRTFMEGREAAWPRRVLFARSIRFD